MNAESLARRTAQSMAVHDFVARWNTGEGSMISDMHDLDTAFSFDEGIDRIWGIALIEAQSHGIQEEFHAAFGALVQPTINETFETGLKKLCASWARKAATELPSEHGLAAPFDDVSDWVTWCLATLEWPPFARPQGEELIPDEQAEQLLRHALAQEHEPAVEHGWVSGEPHAAPHAARH